MSACPPGKISKRPMSEAGDFYPTDVEKSILNDKSIAICRIQNGFDMTTLYYSSYSLWLIALSDRNSLFLVAALVSALVIVLSSV